ncbi:hypothetical protein EAG_06005 [Camponotus floridanus]|uniref:Uncharacterized protein n=1 Tax=Camponotus floridanus TaxID=104421 RepID=E2AKT7_CAMFO|nr:uncharacterized protein LOC105253556 [Camponotus floridanus]EFN65960.1 hypothetical protein EAG_06005 [Camponotus floridanus]
MVKVNIRWKTAEDYNLLRGSSFATKINYFWRKGWTEIPVVMGGSILMLAGFAMGGYAIYYGLSHDMTPKYYKTTRIYRPDDPRVQTIRYVSVLDS